MGAATRRRGHGAAAEVVASVDVTAPTAAGGAAHVKISSLLAFKPKAPHFATRLTTGDGGHIRSILCVCFLSCS